MKIECVKEKFEEAISYAGRVAGKNLSLPVLECVLLTPNKNTLEIRATNLDLGIEITISAKVSGTESIAVPAELLSRFLGSLSKEKKITLELKDKNLIISTDSTSTTIKTFPHEDFPTIPYLKEKPLTLDGSSLDDGFRSVWYSASPSSMKPELSSVYVGEGETGLVFAATDSFRLAEKKVFGIKSDGFTDTLIPFKNVPEILRFFEKSNRKVEVRLGSNQISFSTEGLYLTSRVIDGTFPDYKQIIPKEHNTEVVILKQDLIDALKTSHIFANKFSQINFKVSPSKKKITLYTENEDIGKNTSDLKAAVTGEEIEISFNYRYVMDCFQSIPQDSVSMQFSGVGKPLVIEGVGDETFTYLVMPMNR